MNAMPILQLLPNTLWGPAVTCVMDNSLFQLITQSKLKSVFLKSSFLACTATCSFAKGHSLRSLQLDIDVVSKYSYSPFMEEAYLEQLKNLKVSREELSEPLLHDLDGNQQVNYSRDSNLAKDSRGVSFKELERRRKIGLANKGRTSWNKGIKHSAETRMRIKKRTIEALRNPKVRKKMSERPHSHSDRSKARISFAMRRIWQERLKHKRSQGKLYSSWAGYIAEAAKQGIDDERELGWDSFQKIKAELGSQYLREREEKAKAREAAKVRADEAARERAEKHAQQRRKKKEQAKIKAMSRESWLNRKKKNALARELKLMERLAKIQHGKRQLDITVNDLRVSSLEHQPFVEMLDLELIKIEKKLRRVSLAYQLQRVKGKKKEVSSHLL